MSAKVAQKIHKAMQMVDYLQKDGKVEFKRTQYTYLSEEKITSEIRQALGEVGLILYPAKMDIIGEKEVQTRSGTSRILNILVTYRIQDTESGEYIEVQALGEGMDSGDKTVYKAMTGAFKYAQRQTFMIPTGDDPDQISSDELKNGKVVTMPQKKKWPNEPIERVQTNGNNANFQSFWANAKNLGYTEDEVHKVAGVDSLKGYSQKQLNSLLIELNKLKNK